MFFFITKLNVQISRMNAYQRGPTCRPSQAADQYPTSMTKNENNNFLMSNFVGP